MRKFFRALCWTLGGLAVLLVAGAGGLALWLSTSLPETAGSVTVAGLDAPAEIARDRDGLVHIHAETVDGAYFALGYAHAQDRLWQMEAMRRLGTGRLAEIAGERFLPQDRLMRTLGIGRLAAAGLGEMSPEARAALDSYTRGINAWMATHDGALPPEFTLLAYRPEPWRPADSLIWGRIMALSLSGGWRRELMRALLMDRLGEERIARLYPPYPEDAPVSVPAPAHAGVAPRPVPNRKAGLETPGTRALLATLAATLTPGLPGEGASNAWVVSGARTMTGKPVLANDPHLAFHAPNVWYLARITAPGLTLAGATAPGVPFHVLGHNGRIAWGMSTTGADTQDLVTLRLAPGDPGQYLTPAGPRPFTTREEVISVRGGADVILTLRESPEGPVVSGLSAAAATAAGPDAVLVLRAAALRPDDATAEALYRINRARDWEGFPRALALFHSPVQNLSYADTDGHIGFSVAGRVPIRHSQSGEWEGFIPADALPRLFDPPRGLIVNANNRVVGPGYPYLIARDWEEPYRALRIEQVLDAGRPHDVEASRALQMDTLSLAARELVPVLLRLTPTTPGTAPALDLLREWDGVADRERPEALIFTAWAARLMERLLTDELGPLYDDFARLRPMLIGRALTTDTGWCDDIRTPEPAESCAEVSARALKDALADLTARFGAEMGAWRWGAAHRARFRNRTLDWIPLIGDATRISIATDGDDFTVNRGTSRLSARRWPGEAPGAFTHVHGATLRAVYDLADLDASLFAMPGGQSGNPFSDHYRDLTRPWRDGVSFRLPARPHGVIEVLRLVPRTPVPGPGS